MSHAHVMSPDAPLASLEELFERGRRLPIAERAAFVASCSADPAVRRELASLLEASEEAPAFFESLATSLLSRAVQPGFTEPDGRVDPDPMTWKVVSHYQVEELLGAGGMGVVYRARDLRLGREVALKFLPRHLGGDDRARRRFLAEARAVAALDHPNVCALHEIGEDEDGRVFIAMGYYGGETLDRVLERGRPTAEEAMRWARQIASALRAAHARGIVHRDIKPGNILLSEDGTLKLLDFGLAKLGDATLTEVGRRLGTVAYMSPEQTRGGTLGAETDLWSLGVVLYEMLTGRRPFTGGNAAVILEEIRHGRPTPPSADRDELSEGLDQLVLGLLSPDPAARRGPFRALLGEPEGFGADEAARPWVRWLRVAVAGGFVAAAVVGGLLLYGRFSAPALPEIRRLAVLPLADSTHAPEQHYVVEGLHQALVEDLTRNRAITVTSTDAVEPYRDRDLPPARIARELGVDAMIVGAVREKGDSLQVDLRLLGGDSGLRLWAGSYGGSGSGDALALPSRMAAGISAAVGAERRGPGPAAADTGGGREPGAEYAYLKGLYEIRRAKDMFDTITRERDVRAAVGDLEEAVALEPDWAEAHARLAQAYHWLAVDRPRADSSEDYWERSRAEALRAVSLDESEAQGFASLGYVLFAYEHNWMEAERAMRRAIQLEPSSDNHWIYAIYLAAVGRFDESIEHFREAEKRDPVSRILKLQEAQTYVCAGRYDEAVAEYEVLRQWVGPTSDEGRVSRAYAYAHAGRYREAIASLEDAIVRTDSAYQFVAGLTFVEAKAGDVGKARVLVRWLDDNAPGWGTVFPGALAAAGQLDRAAVAFQRLLEQYPIAATFMRCDEAYPYLRGDPRIQGIERSLHFPS